MEIAEWWPLLMDEQRQHLTAHNGEPLPAELVAAIVKAGGDVASDGWWVGESGPTGFYLSGRAVDWVEAVANGEAGLPLNRRAARPCTRRGLPEGVRPSCAAAAQNG